MRLINADEAIINFGFEWDDIPPTIEEFVRFLKKQPTVDAVEVVRCRECKYRFKNNGHSRDGCPIVDAKIWMDDDDFCSHGELIGMMTNDTR